MSRKPIRILLTFIGALLLAYLTAAVISRPIEDNPFVASQTPLVIAHQGGEQIWPSNTMYAFERAIELGVDVLEMDVHSTRDGTIILMHDDTVDRTTDGSGAIAELTFSDIQALDAGAYWTEDDGASFPFAGLGITVPTLEAMFQRFPDIPMNIELKPAETDTALAVCDLIRQYGKEDDVLIASFHPTAMNAFRAACPDVATSSNENEIRIFFGLNTVFLGAAYSPASHAFQVPEYSGDIHVLTPRFVNGAKQHNIAVHVWTINDPVDMERFIALGVDGIITDRPDLLMALLRR